MGWHNVLEGHGIGLTLVGMAVVFSGLVLVVLYIASVPKLIALVGGMRGVRLRRPVAARAAAPAAAAAARTDEAALLAAIGYVLRREWEAEQALDNQQITMQPGEAPEMWAIVGKMRTLSMRRYRA